MERALALTPGLHTARLQLGLLYLTQANVEASTRTLAPLAERKDGNYFGLFALGLLHLMHDRFPACRAALTQGIALHEENDALNGDMKKYSTHCRRRDWHTDRSRPPQKATCALRGQAE
jgi:hypothetical protein